MQKDSSSCTQREVTEALGARAPDPMLAPAERTLPHGTLLYLHRVCNLLPDVREDDFFKHSDACRHRRGPA